MVSAEDAMDQVAR